MSVTKKHCINRTDQLCFGKMTAADPLLAVILYKVVLVLERRVDSLESSCVNIYRVALNSFSVVLFKLCDEGMPL